MPDQTAPTRLRDLAAGRTDLMKMDPSIIRIEKGHNPRDYRLPENRAHLDSLKTSIRAIGVLNPLMVRFDAGQAVLVDGECRLTAVLELINEGTPIKTVPVAQVVANNEAERIMLAVTANTGKSLSEWELGNAFKRLRAFGWSDEDIATKSGVTPAKVARCVELADAPQDVKQLLSERAVSPALALQVIRKKGTKAGTEELKAKAAEHKASGKKGPAKAAKQASKKAAPAKGAIDWEKLCRAVYNGMDQEGFEAVQKDPNKYEWLEVRVSPLRKIAAAIEGTK